MEGGSLHVDPLVMENRQTRVSLVGSIDLDSGRIAARVRARVRGAVGLATIPVGHVLELEVGGTATEPEIRLANMGETARVMEAAHRVAQQPDALQEIVLDLDVATKTPISFNSISHSSFPMDKATLTVVGLPEESLAGGLEGAAKAVANGEVYFVDGSYWTVSETNINSALA